MGRFPRPDIDDDLDLPPRPQPIDQQAFRQELSEMVEGLLPDAVDDATPHVLDRFIDKRILVQIERLVRAWAEYEDQLMPHIVEAEADLAYQHVTWEADRRRLDEARISRDASVEALAGDRAEPPGPPTVPIDPEPDADTEPEAIAEVDADPDATVPVPTPGSEVERIPDPAPEPSPFNGAYAEPGLLSGRGAGIWVYLAALFLAAVADVGNFYQIIQFALPSQNDFLLALIVAGLTGCVLFIAHATGVMLRAKRAAEPWVPQVLIWACLGVWALLALSGLYLRLNVHQATHTSSPAVIGQPSTPTPTPAATGTTTSIPVGPSALVFFSLYLGTGVVAAVGGYLTHNPAGAAYRRARKRYERFSPDTADAAQEYVESRGRVRLLHALLRNGRKIQEAEHVELLQTREELKQWARARIAQRRQDAALTDAYFPEE